MLACCLVHVQTLAKYMHASRAQSDYRNSLLTGKKESKCCERSGRGGGSNEGGSDGAEAEHLQSPPKDASSSASLSSFSGNRAGHLLCMPASVPAHSVFALFLTTPCRACSAASLASCFLLLCRVRLPFRS